MAPRTAGQVQDRASAQFRCGLESRLDRQLRLAIIPMGVQRAVIRVEPILEPLVHDWIVAGSTVVRRYTEIHKDSVMLRPEKLEDQVQFLLSTLIQREVRDPDLGFLTLTAVRMTGDRGIAKVYYTVLGEAAQQDKSAKALARATGFLRTQLAKRLKLKKAPELRFFFDATLEEGNKMETLFAELEKERLARPVVDEQEN